MAKAFNPEMLALARESKGFTQGDLIERLALPMSQGKLSKIENGLIPPTEEDVTALADALGYRREFFYHPHLRRAEPATYHRKRQKLSKGDWARIYARAEIYRITASIFLRSVELAPSRTLPPFIDPDEVGGRVDDIARAVRQAWSMPRGPVEDVTSLMESAGIVVVPFDFGTELCDGFCQSASEGMPPIVFINTRQPKDRLRYSLAHELGHLVMHKIPNPEMERQANLFASEFLMPTADIAKDFYSLSLEKFMALKKFWKTSMAALMLKARDIGRMTESAHRYYMINMSKRGWRAKEPVEIEARESPKLIYQLVRAHMGHLHYTLDDLSALTGLPAETFKDFFGLVSTPKFRIVT
jgi:Zn-dependent peptidase ImmA (M78 family)/transcriptional regulator with XRE-family HTH domain